MGAYLLPIGHKGKVSLLSQKILLPSDTENPLVNPIPPIRSHEIKIEYLANFIILCFLCQVSVMTVNKMYVLRNIYNVQFYQKTMLLSRD